MRFVSSKTFPAVASVCFRQWRAESHCRLLHGYALTFRFEFEAETLDARNWVVDFGGLKELRRWIEDTFDHKLVVAEDDPHRAALERLAAGGLAEVVVVKATGCEAFAALGAARAAKLLFEQGMAERVRVSKVEVSEHLGNSAMVVA